jgi:hypothetical protein
LKSIYKDYQEKISMNKKIHQEYAKEIKEKLKNDLLKEYQLLKEKQKELELQKLNEN